MIYEVRVDYNEMFPGLVFSEEFECPIEDFQEIVEKLYKRCDNIEIRVIG